MPEAHHVEREMYDVNDKPHPWVVMSTPRLHSRNLGLFQAIPLTSGPNADLFREFRVQIPPEEFEIYDDRLRDIVQLAVTEQFRALSEKRLDGRAGKLSKKALNQLRAGLAYILAFDEFVPP